MNTSITELFMKRRYLRKSKLIKWTNKQNENDRAASRWMMSSWVTVRRDKKNENKNKNREENNLEKRERFLQSDTRQTHSSTVQSIKVHAKSTWNLNHGKLNIDYFELSIMFSHNKRRIHSWLSCIQRKRTDPCTLLHILIMHIKT